MTADIYELYRQARLSRDPRFDGRFFIAVKSTGIFCRPVCPAKLPLEKNVIYYQTKEEAINAGYRPCLRCKPEFSPCFNEISHRSILLNKAVALIQSGKMLTSTVEEISAALFTSPRNINKVFTKYYGIPLKKFQDISKALFAKKLLFCSDLTIPEISEACGYSSVSGLYNLINRYLKIPIRNLDDEKKESIYHTISLKIPCLNSYNWEHFLDFQSKRLIENIECILESSYSSTIKIEGIKGYFKIKPSANIFVIDLSKSFLSVLPSFLKKITSMLDLETNTNLIEARFKELYPSVQIQSGLHIPGVSSPYEAGIRAICGQQVSISAATRLLNQFVSIFSNKDDSGNHYFPSPNEITIKRLEQMKVMQSKKDALFLFSQWCCKNDINLCINDLIHIKGIGKWTIDYIKLRAMNEPDIWMGTDLGIKKVISKYGDMNASAAAPWKSYLSIHLWDNL